jgi:HlyD family secretion protein
MRKFFTKKRIIWTAGVIVVLLIIGLIVKAKNGTPTNILTDTVKKQDLKQTVLSTGVVTSSTDLNLSFKSSGIVNQVSVKVGDQVSGGQVLANLEQREQAASLTTARGALAQAEANYQKVLAGASSEDVKVAESTVDAAQVSLGNAKKSLQETASQQAVAVSNAYSALLNSTIAALASPGNANSPTVTITGSYKGALEGSYKISVLPAGSSPIFVLSGLESGQGDVRANIPVPLGSRGLYIQFSSNTNLNSGDTWTVDIPNQRAANYLPNKSAYEAALQTQQSAINTAQSAVNSAQAGYDSAVAQLSLKKAEARPADVAAVRAQILSAQGQVQAAQAGFENTVIRAPAAGTITRIDVKPGELASALKEAIVLQDVEANISEANIANIKLGQNSDMTFDALGPDRHFKGSVQTVDPASTVVSGVVNYKVTASLEKLPEIKPGMTANMTILTAEVPGVLSVPARAIISHDNKKFVRVIKDPKKKTYEEKEVTIGAEADGGLVEVKSGLNEGQEIVTFIKQ